MSGMKIMITGSSGFVGEELTKRLLKEGHDLVLADIREPKTAKTGFRRADILNSKELTGLFKEFSPDAVCHLAAQIHQAFSVQNPLKDLEINTMGTVNVLESCRNSGVKKIIFASSAAVYGTPEKNPVSESHALAPSVPYGFSKLSAEEYVRMYSKLYGMEHVILRFFNIYGSRGAGVIPIFVRNALEGRPITVIGSGEQQRDFLYITDAADAYELALRGLRNDIFNVGSGKGTSINQIAHIVKKEFPKVKIKREPETGKEDSYPIADITKIKSKGFEPETTLEKGIKSMINLMNK